MTPRLFVRAAARSDMAEAVAWYESRRAGLGQEFLDAVAQSFARIETSPEQFRFAVDDIRMAVVRHFPYVVYFVGLRKHIAVLAVVHGHRNPTVWQRRREQPG
jgi:toxin ParE1/3/4